MRSSRTISAYRQRHWMPKTEKKWHNRGGPSPPPDRMWVGRDMLKRASTTRHKEMMNSVSSRLYRAFAILFVSAALAIPAAAGAKTIERTQTIGPYRIEPDVLPPEPFCTRAKSRWAAPIREFWS